MTAPPQYDLWLIQDKIGCNQYETDNSSRAMRRAWAIFRRTYYYPRIKFSDIGRKCFAGCGRRGLKPARLPASLR